MVFSFGRTLRKILFSSVFCAPNLLHQAAVPKPPQMEDPNPSKPTGLKKRKRATHVVVCAARILHLHTPHTSPPLCWCNQNFSWGVLYIVLFASLRRFVCAYFERDPTSFNCAVSRSATLISSPPGQVVNKNFLCDMLGIVLFASPRRFLCAYFDCDPTSFNCAMSQFVTLISSSPSHTPNKIFLFDVFGIILFAL